MNASTRMVAALAIVAIMAVAAIGAGFAYTATTENSDNTAANEYILVFPDDAEKTGADYTKNFEETVKYSTKIGYDGTVDPRTPYKVTYGLSDFIEMTEDTFSGFKVVQLGSIGLNITNQDGTALATETGKTFNLNITVPAASVDPNLRYFAKVVADGDGANTIAPADKLTEIVYMGANYGASIALDAEVSAYTVCIAAGLPGNASSFDKHYSALPAVAEKVLTSATVSFTVDSDSLLADDAGFKRIAGVTLEDQKSMVILNPTTSTTATALPMVFDYGKVEGTTGTATWTVGAGVTAISVNEGTGVISVVTVPTDIGDHEYEIVCTYTVGTGDSERVESVSATVNIQMLKALKVKSVEGLDCSQKQDQVFAESETVYTIAPITLKCTTEGKHIDSDKLATALGTTGLTKAESPAESGVYVISGTLTNSDIVTTLDFTDILVDNS